MTARVCVCVKPCFANAVLRPLSTCLVTVGGSLCTVNAAAYACANTQALTRAKPMQARVLMSPCPMLTVSVGVHLFQQLSCLCLTHELSLPLQRVFEFLNCNATAAVLVHLCEDTHAHTSMRVRELREAKAAVCAWVFERGDRDHRERGGGGVYVCVCVCVCVWMCVCMRCTLEHRLESNDLVQWQLTRNDLESLLLELCTHTHTHTFTCTQHCLIPSSHVFVERGTGSLAACLATHMRKGTHTHTHTHTRAYL